MLCLFLMLAASNFSRSERLEIYRNHPE